MQKARVLLVEDDQSILKVTKVRLEHEGYEVVTATDGEDALRKAARELPIHVILLDVMLPKRNGYEVCRALRQGSATATIPVIIFSASESHAERLADRCTEVGATDWIKKPFQTTELLAKIHHAMKPIRAGRRDEERTGEEETSHG